MSCTRVVILQRQTAMQSRISPGFNDQSEQPSVQCGIWEAADAAVLIILHKIKAKATVKQ